MIDIHCHILPGIDDGAQSVEDALAMAKEAVTQGITTIIATPHYNSKYSNDKAAILAKAAELNRSLSNAQIPLTILPGQEIRISGEMIEEFDAGKLLPLAETSYLFVELPSGHVPRYTERVLFDLQMKGLIPIIVHPERNSEIMENPDLLYSFVKNGALTQITASSLTGHFGKKIKKFSEQLIQADLAHFIASDAHNITTRSFKNAEAFAVVEKKFGIDAVMYLQENAALLASGKKVFQPMPSRIPKKKFLGLF